MKCETDLQPEKCVEQQNCCNAEMEEDSEHGRNG